MKKALALMLSAILTASVLASCGTSTSEPAVNSGTTVYGDRSSTEYRQVYASEFTTLNYLQTGNSHELRALANTIDGLTEYDTYGNVQPALAESWEHNDDYTVWTFKIREGVKWVDAEGNEVANVTAQDWVDAAEYVNNANNDASAQYLYDGFVKNAQAYYETTSNILLAENAVAGGEAATVEEYYAANDIDTADFLTDFSEVGVKALDTYTLEYTTESSCPYFISLLSYSSYLPVNGDFLREQGENFGIDNYSVLYCGAYIFSEYEPQVRRVLTENPTYWDPDSIYIKKLEYIYNAQASTLAPTMFQKGEVDFAQISADVLDEWMNNAETSDIVRPEPVDISYSYFYAFNFEPRFDEVYEPENWTLAVNNENFRQAVMAALDREKALAVQDPYTPELLVNNTITPATFAVGDGKDYTEYDGLAEITARDSFDETKAKEYAALAKTELTAAGATFPIKVLMPYNPATTNWDKECQVVEQQIEGVLGSDFIDIIVEAGPSTGFLGEVRRSGKFALMKCNWGADYADPQTWTDPFNYSTNGAGGNSYNFMYTDAQKLLLEQPVTGKSAETQATVAEYYTLLDAAKAITTDEAARYEAFAKAEAFLIDHAIVVPYSVDFYYGYVADMLNPYDRQFAPFGLAPYRYKGRQLLEKPMSQQEFLAARDAWEAERVAAIAE
ncbi:MAG: peptide ABC transporter substrate-binding protein [Oscillospiraceae bacterium]